MFFQESDVSELVTCPVCSEMYSDPRLLPCGETVCKSMHSMLYRMHHLPQETLERLRLFNEFENIKANREKSEQRFSRPPGRASQMQTELAQRKKRNAEIKASKRRG
jgi:hypothetical protein